ncbi:hypothetical protein FS837_004752 [Tulasnella sp. UAMH 9824]|nr:hypothetical protein FS837_004752 [Tulasnella sp. UAMH 9824]
MPMQLPVEIIGRIIQLIYLSTAKRKAILPLLLVSPTFRIETERLLYSHICLRTLAQVVRCFQTINARPNIPRTVRQLHVSITLNSALPAAGLFDFIGLDGTVLNDEQVLRMREARAAKLTGKVLRPFGDLVHRTLNKLVSLQEYSLSLGSAPGRDELAFAPMWLPAQAPFKLRRFIVDLNLSPAMTRFLQSQSSITDLLAPHFYNQPGRLPLPKGSLPKLRGLVLSPEAAGSIVPGRPVKRVVLKPSGQRGAPRMIDAITNAIPSLAKSTVAVKSIDVMAPQIPDVVELLLKPLAAGLPNLENIALRRPFIFPDEHVYDVYESDAFSAALAEFQNLKTLQLPAPPPHHHLREAGIINEMVEPFPGAPLTIQANINGQIFAGPVPPAPPPPVVFGPPLPPNFHNLNGNDEDDQADAPLAAEGGVGAGAVGLQGLGGGFFAIPLGGGGFFGGGMLPPLPAGPPAGNAPQPPAAGPGGGGLPNFFQNLFGFNQPPVNQNAHNDPNDPDAAAPAPQPPAPALNQGIGLDLPNIDDAPPLMDDPGDGEVVADFFVVTAGPMPGEEGGNGDGNEVDPADPQPQLPQQADENPLPGQPGAANAGPPPPPPR